MKGGETPVWEPVLAEAKFAACRTPACPVPVSLVGGFEGQERAWQLLGPAAVGMDIKDYVS